MDESYRRTKAAFLLVFLLLTGTIVIYLTMYVPHDANRTVASQTAFVENGAAAQPPWLGLGANASFEEPAPQLIRNLSLLMVILAKEREIADSTILRLPPAPRDSPLLPIYFLLRGVVLGVFSLFYFALGILLIGISLLSFLFVTVMPLYLLTRVIKGLTSHMTPLYYSHFSIQFY